MEGRAHLGSNHLEKGTPFLRPKPALSPLERFLSSPCERELNVLPCSKDIAPKRVKKDEMMRSNGSNGMYHEPSPLGVIGVLPRGVLLDESGIYNGLLVGGGASYCSFNNGGLSCENIGKEVVKAKGGNKGSCSSSTSTNNTNVVKGQWTAEEDSLLVKLVKQHGVRKWSQIAKKLVGRIGKQCRERWHNHLRPDIKKDTWSEEEERLLVQAHEKVGNRWAEIAKTIPGRSENSIKNHWNATKRRQNSKRKSKRKTGNGSRSQPSILQEYIRSKILIDQNPNTTTPSIPSSQFQTTSPNLFDIAHMTTSDDCMQTMQNFYENFSEQSVAESLDEEGNRVCEIQEPYIPDSLDFLSFDEGQFMGMDECLLNFDPQNQHEFSYGECADMPPVISNGGVDTSENNSSHLCSDVYLSYLLDGGPSPSFDSFESDNFNFLGDQDSSPSCKKDMDLIEMITSSSQSSCSRRSNSNSNSNSNRRFT